MNEYKIVLAGDQALLIEFENVISEEINGKIKQLYRCLQQQQVPGIIDLVPTYCSLLITYDNSVINYKKLCKIVYKAVKTLQVIHSEKRRIIEIPVCYGGQYGPDLENVAKHTGLTPQEVINRHCGRDYLIYMIGFLPGFPYLGGMDKELSTPRLDKPRLKIAAGSVGIAGEQTGIYPLESPGGWQLIGRTPLKLYVPENNNPVLYEAGDYIRFVRIDEEEYERIQTGGRQD